MSNAKDQPFLDWESFFSFPSRAVFSDESVLTLSLRAFSSVLSGVWTPFHPSASCKTKRSAYYSIFYKKYSKHSTTYPQQLKSMLHLLSRQVTSRCDLGSTRHNNSLLGHSFNPSYNIPRVLGI